jgi:predicted secreted protein
MNNKTVVGLLAAVAVVLVAGGVYFYVGASPSPVSNSSNPSIQNNSPTIQVSTQEYYLSLATGEAGQLSLPVNPSTGTSWWVQSAPTSVISITNSSGINSSINCGAQMAGCSNQLTIYSFNASTPGNYTVELRLGHSWAQNEYYEIVMVHLTVQNSTS